MNSLEKENFKNITPMNLMYSVVYFGIPAIVFYLSFHVFLPWLINHKITPFYAWFFSLLTPLVLLLIASFILFFKEQRNFSFIVLKKRFRLKKLNVQSFLLSVLLFFIIFITMEILKKHEFQLIKSGYIKPSKILNLIGGMFGNISGNWSVFILIIILLFFNIIGEEFYFRGYILPKQELYFKKYTWIIHGMLWITFHVFKWWEMIGLLPLTFLLPLVVQKTKNTTVGIVIHSVVNGITLINILPLIIS